MPDSVTNAAPDEEKKTLPSHRVPVWDLPIRIFHWLLVLLVVLSFVTGKMGGTVMQYHEWSGVAVLVLLLFRLIWGFVGGAQARFSVFVTGPRKVFDYARSFFRADAKHYLGHNPMGGWSIIAMLVTLSIQAGTGLFANDDILTEGPLFEWVSKDTSDWLTRIHHINQNVLVALVALHIGAILFYLVVKRENLVAPMITGFKHWHEAVDPARATGSVTRAFFLATALAVFTYAAIYG